MIDISDAAREVRDAINVLEDSIDARLVDVRTELRHLTEVLLGIKSALRDISDVLHAEYYGEHPGEHLGEEPGEEGEPGNDAQ